jgi:CHAD domain-containing protein
MAATTGSGVHEVERKYEIPDAVARGNGQSPTTVAIEPALTKLPHGALLGAPTNHELEATYFDTADLRLAARGIRLRRRAGGPDEGWHLKLPAGALGVLEVHRPLGPAGGPVPGELAGLVTAIARGRELAPVLRMTTSRTERPVLAEAADRSAPDRVLALVVEDEVSAQSMGESTTLSSWREIEVELVEGDEALLDAIEKRLLSAGLRRSTDSAKVVRALGSAVPVAWPPTDGTASRSSSSGAVIGRYIRAQVSAILANDPWVRRDEEDSVHKMRVATRRLRSTLRTFRPLFDRSQTDPVMAELKWLAGVLGEVRDAEVLRARLLRDLDSLPVEMVLGAVRARVQRELTGTLLRGRERLLRELDGARYFRLLDALDRLVAAPPLTDLAAQPAGVGLPPLVRRAYRRLRRRLAALPGPDRRTQRDHELHESRKDAKRLRYAGEAVSDVFGKPAVALVSVAEEMQELLGDHQDGVVLSPLLRQMAIQAFGAGDNGFTYGLLLGRELCRAAAVEDHLSGVVTRLEAKKIRRWLGA